MQHKYHTLVLNALLLLFVTKVCIADLMCYECKNCAKISNDTPKVTCNAAYFESASSTSVQQLQTTEVYSSSTSDSMLSSSTEETSSSTAKTSTTTIVVSIEDTQTTTPSESSTTVRTSPTPITVRPAQTTVGLPTPPNVTDHIQFSAEESTPQSTEIPNSDADSASTGSQIVNALQSLNVAFPGNAGFPTNNGWQGNELPITTPNTQSSEGPTEEQPDEIPQFIPRLRQRRDATNYQCYKVKRSVNGLLVTDRGCSRVEGMQPVCKKLELEFGMESKMNKCATCTKPLCNGSNAIGASISLILFSVIAGYLRRK